MKWLLIAQPLPFFFLLSLFAYSVFGGDTLAHLYSRTRKYIGLLDMK